jgi:hypothetical protein
VGTVIETSTSASAVNAPPLDRQTRKLSGHEQRIGAKLTGLSRREPVATGIPSGDIEGTLSKIDVDDLGGSTSEGRDASSPSVREQVEDAAIGGVGPEPTPRRAKVEKEQGVSTAMAGVDGEVESGLPSLIRAEVRSGMRLRVGLVLLASPVVPDGGQVHVELPTDLL